MPGTPDETRTAMTNRFPDNNLGAIDADDLRALVDAVYDLYEAPAPTVPPGITWRGAYSAATAYVPGDIISYAGRYWLAAQASTGSTPA
jgi:hypothetical protein